MIKKSYNGGYSLIELVIYLAIFVGLSVVIVHSLVTVMRTNATAQSYRKLQTNGELIMERMTREIRDASSINSASSVFGTNPGTLYLTSVDESDALHSIVFSVINGAVQIDDNGATGNLSTSEVSVSSLIFRRIIGGSQDGVKIEMTLTTSRGYIRRASFFSTVVFRGNP